MCILIWYGRDYKEDVRKTSPDFTEYKHNSYLLHQIYILRTHVSFLLIT